MLVFIFWTLIILPLLFQLAKGNEKVMPPPLCIKFSFLSMIRGNSPLYKWRITRETRATEDFSAFYFLSFRQLIRSPGIVPTTNQRCAKIWPHQHRRERLCVRPDTYVQGWVVYKIKCCDCQSTYISEIGRNLSTRLSKLNERPEMVTSTITLLNTIYRRNITSTGTLRHVLRILQTTINDSL